MTLAEKLLHRRQELNFTQGEVAAKLHVSRQAISNWELGKNYPDLEILITISDVYQISLDALLKDDKVFVDKLQKGTQMEKIIHGFYFIAALSLIISLIVNFAIDHQLTWSLIVALSLAVLSLISLTYRQSKDKKIFKTSLVTTLLVPSFLFLLEKILSHSQFNQTAWFFSLGLPLSLLWLVIIWLVVWLHFKGQQNWFLTAATLAVLSIPGNIVTRLLIEQQLHWSFATIVNTLSALLITALCLYLNKKFPSK